MENLSRAWDKLESAYENLECAIGEAHRGLRKREAELKHLEEILKSIVDNDGKMRPTQIIAVANYYGWEIK